MKYAFYFVVLFLTSAASYAEDCSTVSHSTLSPLTIFTEHWPPYQRLERGQELSGISVDIVKNVLDKAKWPYEIKVMPWAQAVEHVNNTPNSLIFSLARFPEREDKFQWITPLTTITSKLLRFNNQLDITITQIEDVKNYRLALKRGEASSTYFLENNMIDEENIIWIKDSSQALKLLSIGRADIYPITVGGFHEAIKDSNFNASQFSFTYDFKELDVTLYLATSLTTDLSLIQYLSQLFKCQADNPQH